MTSSFAQITQALTFGGNPQSMNRVGRAWDKNQRWECTFASGFWQPRYAAKWLFIVTPLSQHDLQYSRTYTKQTPNQGYTLQHHLQCSKYFPNLLFSHPNQCLFNKHRREKKIQTLEFCLQLESTFWFVSSQLFLFEDCQALRDEMCFLGVLIWVNIKMWVNNYFKKQSENLIYVLN